MTRLVDGETSRHQLRDCESVATISYQPEARSGIVTLTESSSNPTTYDSCGTGKDAVIENLNNKESRHKNSLISAAIKSPRHAYTLSLED